MSLHSIQCTLKAFLIEKKKSKYAVNQVDI